MPDSQTLSLHKLYRDSDLKIFRPTPHTKNRVIMICMQEIFLDIRKLLKSCVCDALGLVSRKEFETQ